MLMLAGTRTHVAALYPTPMELGDRRGSRWSRESILQPGTLPEPWSRPKMMKNHKNQYFSRFFISFVTAADRSMLRNLSQVDGYFFDSSFDRLCLRGLEDSGGVRWPAAVCILVPVSIGIETDHHWAVRDHPTAYRQKILFFVL